MGSHEVTLCWGGGLEAAMQIAHKQSCKSSVVRWCNVPCMSGTYLWPTGIEPVFLHSLEARPKPVPVAEYLHEVDGNS